MHAIAVSADAGASGMVLRNFSLAGAWGYLQWILLAVTLCVAVNTDNTGAPPELDEAKRGQAHISAPHTGEIVRSLVWR